MSDPLTACRVVRDETMLDGNARLNLAAFVTTWRDAVVGQFVGDQLRGEGFRH